MNAETELILKDLGFANPTISDLPELQIKFMEHQCELWQYTLERHERLKADKLADISDVIEAEAPMIKKAKQYLFLIAMLRGAYRRKINSSVNAQLQVIEKCKSDPLYFINTWCSTLDPRMLQLGLISRIPYILFPQQEVLLKSIHQWFNNRLSGMIDKSREEGVTWLAVAYLSWHFLFSNGFTAILGSEKEEKVDFSGSNDTLLGKFRYLIYDLPAWFRPKSLKEKSNPFDKQRLIQNDEKGNEIKGEIGDNIGRSGRSSILIIDEYQDISHPDIVRNSVSSTSNCKIYIGTVKGMNHFYMLKNSGEVQTADIWWFNDPRKNRSWKTGKPDMESPWRRYIEATENPVTIAQEYDGNPNASVEGSVIPAEWVEMAVDWMDPPDNSDRVGGFDVATGRGNNEAVYMMREGPVARMPYISPFKTPQECAWAVINKGQEDGIGLLNYDMDGLGDSLIGMLEGGSNPIPFRLNGLRGQSRASDELIPEEGRKYSEKFNNKRAERWFALRKRFERTYEHRTGVRTWPLEALVSIPNDMKLKTQLSQPKAKPGSRMGVESKAEMKARGVPSPDRADCCVYTFSEYNDYDNVVPEFDYSSMASHCKVFTVDHEVGVYEQYVSMYQDVDLSVSILICQWFASADLNLGVVKPLIRVYNEIVEPNADVEDIIKQVWYTTRHEVYPIKEWIANVEMFGDEKTWNRSPDRIYARKGVRLKKNAEYDERGSMMFMNTLFQKNQIEIHSMDCRQLIMQLSQWRRSKGKPVAGLNLAKALCNLLTRLREAKKMGAEERKPKYYYTEAEWEKTKKEAIRDYVTGEVR